MKTSARFRVATRILAFVLAFAAIQVELPAQSGQVEVWIPRTTRAIVVDALTQQLAKDHWNASAVSDYGARFEREVPMGDPLGRPTNGLTLDRLSITFRDLADTLRVTGRLATVTNPSTATEQTVWRDDPRAVQDVAEILATVKGVAQNRRPATDVSVVPPAPMPRQQLAVPLAPPPAALPIQTGSGEDVVYLKDGSIIHGTIVEQRPGISILVRMRDGNTLRYSMDAIDRMTKEPVVGERADATTSVAPEHKEPALAFVLSLLITGAGQGYNGEWGKAVVMFGGAVVGLDLIVKSYNDCGGFYLSSCSSSSSASIGAVLLVGSVLWSVIDAPIAASNINKRSGIAFHPALVPLKSMGKGPTLGIQVGRITF